MIRIILLVCGFICVVLSGQRRLGMRLANDLILTIKKAHLGEFPNGQYAEQYVSAKLLSREDLCIPLDTATYQQVEACTTVNKHQVSCRIVRSHVGFRSGTISFAITILFDGTMQNGQRVQIDIRDALLIATLQSENHAWYLTKLYAIKS